MVGHTHLQFRREVENRIIVNPGSVGQPKSQAPQTAYALWEDDELTLNTSTYDVEATVHKIERLHISRLVATGLIEVLRTGSPSNNAKEHASRALGYASAP